MDFQEEHADLAFTLDFPIPSGTPAKEARRRLDLTIANADWALENRRRRDLPLYSCVQGWDVSSYCECADSYNNKGFNGIAVGGLVPRLRNKEEVFEIVRAIRSTVPDLPVHVFGVGKPETIARLFELGIQSVDSSSYVKLAADGKVWGKPDYFLPNTSPSECLQLAIHNLATACQATLPISAHLQLRNQIIDKLNKNRVEEPRIPYLSTQVDTAAAGSVFG